MAPSNDPLADALAALVQLGLDETLCRRALAETRRRWGGGQVYIPAHDRPARDAVARARVSGSTVKRRISQWHR